MKSKKSKCVPVSEDCLFTVLNRDGHRPAWKRTITEATGMPRGDGYLRSNHRRHAALVERFSELERQGILMPAAPSAEPEEAPPASESIGTLDFSGCLPADCTELAVHMLTVHDVFAHIVTIPIGPEGGYRPVIRIAATEALEGFAAARKIPWPPRRRPEKGWRMLGVFDFISASNDEFSFIVITAEGESGLGIAAAGVDRFAPGEDGPVVYLPVFRVACRGQAAGLQRPPR